MNSWLVTALAADHILQRIRLTADLFGADINMALVAATVSQANLGHILGDPALARAWGCHLTTPPDSLRRPISAYAVASALAQPRETVRRKVKALVAEGYLRELSQGLIVAADYAAQDVGQRVGASAELTGSFCLRLADAGVPGAIALTEEGPAPDGPRMRIVALADTAFTLRFFEDLRLVVDDALTGLTYLAIARANIHHLDWPADLTAVPEDTPISAPRRPVAAIAVAQSLGAPRETIRRQVRKLTDLGYVRLVAGGLTVDPAGLPQPATAEFILRTEANTRRLLTALRGTGLLDGCAPHPGPGRHAPPVSASK